MKLNLITLITINQKPKKIKNITSSLIIILLYEISTLLNNFLKKKYISYIQKIIPQRKELNRQGYIDDDMLAIVALLQQWLSTKQTCLYLNYFFFFLILV